jgi:agmatine deiminase
VIVSAFALLSSSRASARTDAPVQPRPRMVVPGEFEPVSQVFVAWPDDDKLANFVAELVAEAANVTSVVIAVNDVVDRRDIEDQLAGAGADLGAVKFLAVDYTSIWMRDFGPLKVRRAGGPAVIEFEYFGEINDDRLADKVARTLWSTAAVELPIEFEGGNLLSNGAGTCLTTDQLLEQNRGVVERKLRQMFRTRLGCRRLLILPRLAREGTGHIDMFASFVSAKKVLVGRFELEEDPENSQILDRAATTLERAGFEVVRIPMAANDDGVFRTYTNLALINDVILVPVYANAREHEREALGIIGAAYPDREVIAIDSTDVIELGGAIHCVTMTVAE